MVLNTAWPLALSAAVPRVAVPSLKVTLPVGGVDVAMLGVTDAVKVTCRPEKDGFGLEVSVVAVVARLTTVNVNAVEVLAKKPGLPA
jgi:hypothetical protein